MPVTALLSLFLRLPFPVGDGHEPPRDAVALEERDAAPPAASWVFEFAPAEVLYPAYIADPRRATFGLVWIDTRESDTGGASDRRVEIRMGSRFGVLGYHERGDDAGGVQLAGDVGFLGQFDRENATDNIGWDGLYGFHLAWRPRTDLALRVGMAHDSSHVGDEFIERNGRTRIGYTREEVLAGLRYSPFSSWRGYVEYGHAYDLRNEDLMEEGRVEYGLEFEPPPRWWKQRLGPFAALDVSSYEEDDWEENWTVQLGLVHHRAGRGTPWRFGVEYYDGRSVIGEFFQDRERHFAWGVWFDL